MALLRQHKVEKLPLVYDDGTSVLRGGYRYRMAFDGALHEPSVTARTVVLGSVNLLFLAFVIVQFRYFFGGNVKVAPCLNRYVAPYR